MSWCNI